jgi:hypothetical protein
VHVGHVVARGRGHQPSELFIAMLLKWRYALLNTFIGRGGPLHEVLFTFFLLRRQAAKLAQSRALPYVLV